MANFPVTQGTFQNPPKVFTYVIQNGAAQSINYAMNFFRVLSLTTATGVTIKFGQIALASDIFAAGVGYELPEVIQNTEIVNNSGGAITISVVCAIGRIFDDRLNVSGTVTVNPVTPSTLTAASDVAVSAHTTEIVMAANTNRKEAFITNLVANGTVVRVGTSAAGAASGFQLGIGATAIISNTAAIYVYNPSAAGINIGLLESAT